MALSDPSFWLFLGVGLLTGLAAGYLGIGGGVIMVPVLSEYFRARGLTLDQTMTHSFATSLFTAIFTTGASAYQQIRQANLILKAVPWTAAGAVLGGQLGAWLGSNLSGRMLTAGFALFLFFAASQLLRGRPESTDADAQIRIQPLPLILVGMVTGVLAGLFGVGGGIMMTPAFILLFHFPSGRVAGTSSAAAFLIALSAAAGYLMYGGGRTIADEGFWGVIDLHTALPLILGSLATAGLGARLNKRFGGTVFRRVFAGFLVLVAAGMIIRN